jgi:DNA-binding response OmpR family regulator
LKSLDLSELSFLIVDDSSYMRKILRTLLSGYGVRAIMEADGTDTALASIRTSVPDILLVDWEMPGRDGLELIREIRGSAEKEIRFLSIMMISGHSEKSRVMAARNAGINDFLVKPISATTLYNHIAMTVLKEPDFIEAGDYFGPDRRVRSDPTYTGEERRGQAG